MDEEKYVQLFNDFVSLVDKQLERFESETLDIQTIAKGLPPLISLVNTIGYLRGQDGVFVDFRPQTEQQTYFYKVEDKYEDRLEKLIQRVMNSDEKGFYEQVLHSYFCKVRTLQKGDFI